ncbi:MAG: serine/threonine protein kinase [Lentisphaerae bacterium]|nr:MAG: serine/threonine protein kinase [Lentisphaerota bacterium]
MADFQSSCPKCQAMFTASDNQIGKRYICTQCGQECIIPSRRIRAGMQFGNYHVLHPLGLGASGEVHLAKDSQGNLAAIKILCLNDNSDLEVDLKRFQREAQFIHSLNHPGLINVYEMGTAHDYNYIAMEYVRGETVDDYLEKFGPFEQLDALKIVREVALTLKYVWDEHRIVHRDIKPANIMISYDGQVKVMDLGIAKSYLMDFTQLTDPDTIIGSPPYMSPEQCSPSKPIDFRSDMYSLGCTLYQMLTDEYAFFADSPMATVRMHILERPTDPREFNPNLDEEVVDFIMRKLLARLARQRPGSWREVIKTLDALIDRLS